MPVALRALLKGMIKSLSIGTKVSILIHKQPNQTHAKIGLTLDQLTDQRKALTNLHPFEHPTNPLAHPHVPPIPLGNNLGHQQNKPNKTLIGEGVSLVGGLGYEQDDETYVAD